MSFVINLTYTKQMKSKLLNRTLTYKIIHWCKPLRVFLVFFLFFSNITLALASQQAHLKTDKDNSVISTSLTPISVQTNWKHQFQFAGFYAAIKQGYYQKAGLDVTVKNWHKGINVVDEVVEGRADFGVAKGNALAAYAKGSPISLVMASFQYSPLVLLAHERIEDLSQLSGKTVMYDNGMQISGIVNKADYSVKESIIEQKSSGNINDFISRKVDFYAAYATNEPYRLKKENIPYYLLDPKAYGIQNYGDLVITTEKNANLHPLMVEAFKKASIQGWKYAISHQEEMVDYIMQHYQVVKSRNALIDEARLTTQYVVTGDTPIGTVEPLKLMSMAITAKDIGLITREELKKLNMQKFVFDVERTSFTKQEIEYLHKHPVITMAADGNWAPFEFYDTTGGYQGMAADYFKLFEAKLGVHFKAKFSSSWTRIVKEAEQGKVDLFSCAVATPERSQYMRFTQPYLSFPMALAATEKTSYVGEYSQLEGHTISVVRDYWAYEFLKNNYPNIKLMVVSSVKDGLSSVVDGRSDGYLGNLAVINFTMRRHGLEGIRIVGQFKERYELAIGVQKTDPILFGIIEKTLNSITDEERAEIFSRWVQFKVVNNLDKKQLLQIILPALSIILGLLALLIFYIYQKRLHKAYLRQIYELSLATEIDLRTRTILWASESFLALTGYTKEEMQGMPYLKLAREDIPAEFVEYLNKLMLSGKTWVGEMEARTKTGEHYWVELTLSPTKNLWGNVTKILATRVNITDKKRIEKLSISDVLTGLYNRRHYNNIIDLEVRRSQREGLSLGLVMLDIDLFKMVNDTYGHPHGDKVLKQISQLLQDHFNRATDYVFRVGGEEFVVICRFKTRDEFKVYLEQVRQKVEELKIENKQAPIGVVTISIGGVYVEDSKQLHAEKLFKQADKTLYSAKQNGRNQVMIHSQKEDS
ncbi:hypothetical protein JCM30760_04660 [Thiomicrorhabdus hydrogeniphila]